MDQRPPLPFFMTYPMFLQDETNQGRSYDEREYMRQMYPMEAKQYLAVIYGVLDRMDYADSWVYDEYPDQMALLRLVETILRLIPEKTNMTRENQRNLLQILLYDEILRRRQMNGRQQGGRNIFGLSMDGKQFKLD